jgi:hypothetical protein
MLAMDGKDGLSTLNRSLAFQREGVLEVGGGGGGERRKERDNRRASGRHLIIEHAYIHVQWLWKIEDRKIEGPVCFLGKIKVTFFFFLALSPFSSPEKERHRCVGPPLPFLSPRPVSYKRTGLALSYFPPFPSKPPKKTKKREGANQWSLGLGFDGPGQKACPAQVKPMGWAGPLGAKPQFR